MRNSFNINQLEIQRHQKYLARRPSQKLMADPSRKRTVPPNTDEDYALAKKLQGPRSRTRSQKINQEVNLVGFDDTDREKYSVRSTKRTQRPRSPSVDIPLQWTDLNPKWRDMWQGGSVFYPQVSNLKLRKGPATVEMVDIERLDESQFLNDNLIIFYLRLLEETQPQHGMKIYFHNPYFYSALTKQPWQDDSKINYSNVQRWTSKVNLFEYDYIVVPVNENLHWYLAIICNPATLLNQESEARASLKKAASLHTQQVDGAADSKHSDDSIVTDQNVTKPLSDLSINDNDIDASSKHLRNGDAQNEVDSEVLFTPEGKWSLGRRQDSTPPRVVSDIIVEASPEVKRKKKGKTKQRSMTEPKEHDIAAFRIITLDSLGGKHSPVVTNLKAYLKAEMNDKLDCSVDYISPKGIAAPNIPQQSNYCDCGLYLLSYVEEFLKCPDEYIRKILNPKLGKQDHVSAPYLREYMRNYIFELSGSPGAPPPLKVIPGDSKAKQSHPIEINDIESHEGSSALTTQKDLRKTDQSRNPSPGSVNGNVSTSSSVPFVQAQNIMLPLKGASVSSDCAGSSPPRERTPSIPISKGLQPSNSTNSQASPQDSSIERRPRMVTTDHDEEARISISDLEVDQSQLEKSSGEEDVQRLCLTDNSDSQNKPDHETSENDDNSVQDAMMPDSKRLQHPVSEVFGAEHGSPTMQLSNENHGYTDDDSSTATKLLESRDLSQTSTRQGSTKMAARSSPIRKISISSDEGQAPALPARPHSSSNMTSFGNKSNDFLN